MKYLIYNKFHLLIFIVFLSLFSFPSNVQAEEKSNSYVMGVIENINSQITFEDKVNNTKQTKTKLKVRVLEGRDKDKVIDIMIGVGVDGEPDSTFIPQSGAKVLLLPKSEFEPEYEIADYYRLDGIYWQAGIFLALILLVSRLKSGRFLIIGAFITLAVLYILFPLISLKLNYLSKISIFLLSYLFSSVFVVLRCKGWNKKSYSVLISLILSYITTIILSSLFENMTLLNHGEGLQSFGSSLLLISVSGVITFLTYIVTFRISEIKKNNPSMSPGKLFDTGLKVGHKEALTVLGIVMFIYLANILSAFSNTGAELAFWQILNTEIMTGEISKMLTSGIAIILSVPITAFISSRCL